MKNISSNDISMFLSKKENPIIEGSRFANDSSFKWVSQNKDIYSIEKGINILDFPSEQRNMACEFKVKFLFFFKSINFNSPQNYLKIYLFL